MNLAIVGCGDVGFYVARLAWLNRKIRLVACVDPDPERAAYVAKKSGCRTTYRNLDELLEAHGATGTTTNAPAAPAAAPDADSSTPASIRGLDAVYLGVPHDLHLPLVRQTTEAGLAVLCEKPLAHTLEDAAEIARISESGAKIGINYQYRYDHAIYSLTEAVQNGTLGDIRYIRCNVPWCRTADYFGDGGWHAQQKRAGGGTLITQGSHLLDIALLCAGGTVTHASGQGFTEVFTATDVDDLFFGFLETSTGVKIQICSSMVAYPEQPVSIEVYGTRGTVTYYGPEKSRLVCSGVKVRRRKHPVRFYHALGRSIEGFRRWVSGDDEYACPAPEALKVMTAVDMLYKSAG